MLSRSLSVRRALAASLLAAATLLAGCGSEDAETAPSAEFTDATGAVFNDSDIDFVQGMIPHHAQALVMVDLTLDRDLDPEVRRLMDQIRDVQAPEIESMADLLEDWDQPVPATMRDHANAGHGDGEHHFEDMDEMPGMEGMESMPGMLSGAELSELAAASDEEFQPMLLELMIEHHEGAVEMARAEQADGVNEAANALAESIETAQEQEIAAMKDLM